MNTPLSFLWSPTPTPAPAPRLALSFHQHLYADTPDQDRANRWIQAAHWPGKSATATWVPGEPDLLLIGLGNLPDFSPTRLFRSFAAAGRLLADATWIHTLHLNLHTLHALPVPPTARAALAIHGLDFGAYSFQQHGTTTPTPPAHTIRLTCCGDHHDNAAFHAALRDLEILRPMRDTANLPVNARTTREIAEDLAAKAQTAGLSTRLWGPQQLAQAHCGALLAVGRGDPDGPCLLRAEWNPSPEPPLALVGKAILFDAGGLCLKPPKNMEWMQYDKSGGIAVLTAAMLAAARKSPRHVVAWIPITKNLPTPHAPLPGDILRAHNGATIEILNTDAEGRLILADALALAAEEKPAALIDAATLTGAVLVALGHEAAALLGNNKTLLDSLLATANACGERLWPLPLWPEYLDPLKGRFADLKNMGDSTAGTITGAAFLHPFVPSPIPWAHLDIAGVSWIESPSPWAPLGATLFGARLLADWIATR